MYLWGLLAFCAAGSAYGVWSIIRDNARGRVQGRGFGFDRATQPVAYAALMTFNCVVVILLILFSLFLAVVLLRKAMGV
jgi:hypothetical protein